MAESDLAQRVAAVRRFNRFYTRQIGVLDEGYLHSPFSLAEARVLYELAHHDQTTASEIGSQLGLDAGYLSRILRGFEQRGLHEKHPSPTDGRQSILRITVAGRAAFATINDRSHNEIAALLSKLSPDDQGRLVAAMDLIEGLLGAQPEQKVPYVLRPPQPGDMGWVVHRHGILYAQEYGWNEQFEGLVASIVAEIVQRYDPAYERCWIAEVDGAPAGSVFLVKKSENVAKLRLLLVEPSARGMGIGARLVDECLRFARHVGYQKITLWTQSTLLAARAIYAKAGFRLVDSGAHHSFGHDLIEETWELELAGA
jgi:DNA-binding MarR family transcriptional regulator/GNAT superfamily N-acetyltransferase